MLGDRKQELGDRALALASPGVREHCNVHEQCALSRQVRPSVVTEQVLDKWLDADPTLWATFMVPILRDPNLLPLHAPPQTGAPPVHLLPPTPVLPQLQLAPSQAATLPLACESAAGLRLSEHLLYAPLLPLGSATGPLIAAVPQGTLTLGLRSSTISSRKAS